MNSARVLTLPGWLGSGLGHWQSRWEQLHGFERVEQDDWLWPRRGDWRARLGQVLLDGDGTPVGLVAHSLGCRLVAAWATHSGQTAQVRGALLVAPPNAERADTPPQRCGRRPNPRRRLPFRATVLFSEDDPFRTPERARQRAAAWGAQAHCVGRAGHVNGDAGLADWPAGLSHLKHPARLVAPVPG